MNQKDIYTKISEKYFYKDMSNINPLKPLILWANTNAMLDEFYARPNIKLSDSDIDNEIRNIMRHTTGLGLTAREYGNIAYVHGIIKEILDLLEDIFIHKPIGKISPGVLADTITDFQNNHKGIQYMLQNPDATSEDLMNFAYQLAKEQLSIKKEKEKNTSNKYLYDYDKILIRKDILLNNNKSVLGRSDKSKNLPDIVIPLPKEESNYYKKEEVDNKLKGEPFTESQMSIEDNESSVDTQSGSNPYLKGRVEENVYKDSTENKSKGNPTGYSANLAANNSERELLEQLKNNSIADIGIADKIRNGSRILEKLTNNHVKNNSQSAKPSTQEKLEKDELYRRLKKERGRVEVINSNEFSWEQILKDTLEFPNAMRDFCYPSEGSYLGKSSEINTNISDIRKNEYYTLPQRDEKPKRTHGRYLNSAHEEEIERVVSKIFDSVARDLGF